MGFEKLKLPAAVALVCMAFFVTFMQVKANEETDDPVSPAAVWSPDGDDLDDIAKACLAEPAAAYSNCFLDQMGSFASSEAVSFSQTLFQQTPSRAGYLTGLREAGPVDLGYVAYPDAAGFTRGWVLVNGTPAIVDVDNLSALPRAAMEKDAQFEALRMKHPAIALAVENDDRSEGAMPEMLALGDGSQRFVVSYSLQEPCSDCPVLAHASFGFDFDSTGKFLGIKFITMTVKP
jgi:hypothetical protein